MDNNLKHSLFVVAVDQSGDESGGLSFALREPTEKLRKASEILWVANLEWPKLTLVSYGHYRGAQGALLLAERLESA